MQVNRKRAVFGGLLCWDFRAKNVATFPRFSERKSPRFSPGALLLKTFFAAGTGRGAALFEVLCKWPGGPTISGVALYLGRALYMGGAVTSSLQLDISNHVINQSN